MSKQFEFDGATYYLDEMLASNEHDTELCEWLKAAAVGDVFPAIGFLCRVA